jgi:hypothetical protein
MLYVSADEADVFMESVRAWTTRTNCKEAGLAKAIRAWSSVQNEGQAA